MRSLLRLLIAVIVPGAAIQQGWLQAGTRLLGTALGIPGGPGGEVDGMGVLRGLAGFVQGLPDPWYTLVLMTGGAAVAVFLVSLIRTAVRTTTRLSGWLRDVSV